jgi:ATP-dependent exoDNAse (exonuclease V) alpha subunit
LFSAVTCGTKEVFKAGIGQIVAIDLEEGTLTINYDGRSMECEFGESDDVSPACATSIHKSQALEYPAVVIPLAMQHYTLLERNLLYTAVSRGKKLVTIIGQPKALAMAVKNRKSNRRLTKLAPRIAGTWGRVGRWPTVLGSPPCSRSGVDAALALSEILALRPGSCRSAVPAHPE